jgi:hypothetical protein
VKRERNVFRRERNAGLDAANQSHANDRCRGGCRSAHRRYQPSIPRRALRATFAAWYFPNMSTLTEIEAAAEALPRRQQQKLYQFLAKRLEKPAKKKRKPSLHDRMKDLCGIVSSGIPDLATNKKYMEGFGRWKKFQQR